MDYYLKKENIIGPWETSNRIMVCISPNASSKRLIRIAHRFADRFNAEWFAVYVEPAYGFRQKTEDLQQLERNLELAEELEGHILRLTGSVADEIVSFAESKNITLILMGHSRRSRFQELIEGSIINKVIQKSDSQVLVVENEDKIELTTKNLNKTGRSTRSYLKPYIISVLSIAVTIFFCYLIQPFVEAINIPMIFIIPILFTSIVAGRNAGILASVLAVASFDFFFVLPFYSLSVADVRFIPTFVVLLLVGVVTSLMADTIKRQVAYTRQREKFTSALYDFSKDLLTSTDMDDILKRSARHISESFDYNVVILMPNEHNVLEIKTRHGNDVKFDNHEIGVSKWVWEHGESAGCGTDTLSSNRWYHVPLNIQTGTIGVLAVAPDIAMNNEQKHLIESFVSVVALALSSSDEEF